MSSPLRLAHALAASALLVLLTAAPVAAQSGKISGTVRDATTGETLPGVNVRIDGTTQGASTGLDGRYDIIGVRPGEYAVVFSFVGYESRRVEGVRVRIDLTTTVDADLRDTGIQAGEVVVTADRALFQRDVTATTATVSGDEIRELPVENFGDVIALQAGVVGSGGNLHFRGGRAGEVGYWVDGMPVTDVFNGGLAIAIENESVQEVQVVTGAFNAEYGQALSGIVNVVTRDGSNTFEGEVEAWSGDYLGRESARAAGVDLTRAGLNRDLALFPGIGTGDFNPLAVRNLEGAFSGPILRDRLFFFTSGRYFANDGYILGRRAFTLDDVGFDELGRLASLPRVDANGNLVADSSAVAMNPYERTSGQFKLTAQLPAGVRLSGNLILSRESFRDAPFDYLLLPDARRQNFRDARTGILRLTHLLSSRTFYEVGVTNNYSSFQNYLFENWDDERYRDPQFLGYRNPNLFSGFALGGTDNGRFRRTTGTWLLKADLSSQIHRAHLVKTGIEVRRHRLTYLDQFTFLSEVPGQTQPRQLITNGDYDYRPVEFAAYIQDKIEVGGLIVNVGLRADYFNANGIVFRDPTDPASVFPNLRRCQRVVNLQCAEGPDGQPLLRDNPFTPSEVFEASTGAFQLSPRLGVAFPITAGGVVHFSYGQFFQTPNFELLYTNPYFLLSSAGSGLIGLIGNANLRPEQTVNGEIGIKQELTSSSAVELTAYYRDIRNLAGTATDPLTIRGTSARYGRLVNSDFGFVRGVILRYNQRVGRSISLGGDYTFQVARANASDPAQVYNAAAAQQQLETQIVPTGWDQRHTANATFIYNIPRLDAGFSLLASYGSGTPYTPQRTTRVTGGTLPPTVIPLNSETRPSSFNINVTAYRNLRFAGRRLQLWTKVDNLLDTRNETGIFGDTGRATYSLEQSLEQSIFRGDPTILAQRYVRPDFFSQPRRVVVGARVQF